jgi:hypothetical protein
MSRIVGGNKTLLLLTSRPAEAVRERKSVGKEVTRERDITDRGQMEAILAFSRVGAPQDPVNPGHTSPHCV